MCAECAVRKAYLLRTLKGRVVVELRMLMYLELKMGM